MVLAITFRRFRKLVQLTNQIVFYSE